MVSDINYQAAKYDGEAAELGKVVGQPKVGAPAVLWLPLLAMKGGHIPDQDPLGLNCYYIL